MCKIITTFLLIIGLFTCSIAQPLLLKKGKDVSMKYTSTTNVLVDLKKGIETEEKEIYLMAGFANRSATKKQVTFSLKSDDPCKLYYVGKPKNENTFSDVISRNLELIKIEFLEDELTSTILLQVGANPNDIVEVPLKYISKAAKEIAANEKAAKLEKSAPAPPVEVDEAAITETPVNPSSVAEIKEENNLLQYLLTGLGALITLGLGFWLGKRKGGNDEEIVDQPKEVNIPKEKSESIQLNLLNSLIEPKAATENYSFKINDKIKEVQSHFALDSNRLKEKEKDYENINNKLEQFEIEKRHLNSNVQQLKNKLEEAEKLIKNMDYPDYYLYFNQSLTSIFEDLEKARLNLNPDSHFKELFDKILKYDNTNASHPLLGFSKKDNYVLKALKIDSSAELSSLSVDGFFDKFILWHCGNLINNLSKLYAFTQAKDQPLDFSSLLKKDGVKLEHVDTAFSELSNLLETQFNKSIEVPTIGLPFSDKDMFEKVDYSFVKAKFFDLLPGLESGTVYDFNKVALIDKQDSRVIQKAKVGVKV